LDRLKVRILKWENHNVTETTTRNSLPDKTAQPAKPAQPAQQAGASFSGFYDPLFHSPVDKEFEFFTTCENPLQKLSNTIGNLYSYQQHASRVWWACMVAQCILKRYQNADYKWGVAAAKGAVFHFEVLLNKREPDKSIVDWHEKYLRNDMFLFDEETNLWDAQNIDIWENLLPPEYTSY
jgi:hypothetical protein